MVTNSRCILLLVVILLTGCYSKPKVIPSNELELVADSVQQEEVVDSVQLRHKQDSLTFVARHHYRRELRHGRQGLADRRTSRRIQPGKKIIHQQEPRPEQ